MSLPNDILVRFAGIYSSSVPYAYGDLVIWDVDELGYVCSVTGTPSLREAPPGVPWVLYGGNGAVTSVDSGVGSGVTVSPTTGDVLVSSALVAGDGISLTPSITNKEITISAEPLVVGVSSIDSGVGSGITVGPTTGVVVLTSALEAGAGITLSPDETTKALKITASPLCGIYIESRVTPTVTATITIPGLTEAGVVVITYVHTASAGATQYIKSVVPTMDTLTVTCNTVLDLTDQIIWLVGTL